MKNEIKNILSKTLNFTKRMLKFTIKIIIAALALLMVVQTVASLLTPLIIETAIEIAPKHKLISTSTEIIYIEEKTESFDKELLSYIMGMDGKIKRNNPGNLRCASQKYSSCENGFARFPNIVVGFMALVDQVKLDQSRNLTLEQFMNKYAPEKENDTARLIKMACDKLKVTGTDKISVINSVTLAKHLTFQEHSITY